MLIRLTPQPSPQPRPLVVLDTNVVLDWMVFRNAAGMAAGRRIATGEWHWIATAPMRDEFDDVLARNDFDRWLPDRHAIGAEWSRLCAQRPVAAEADARTSPRCSDPNDQKFVDLAATSGAAFLLSRDAAVLKLAGRLSQLAVLVASPDDPRVR